MKEDSQGTFTLNIEPVDIQAEFEDTIYTYMELFKQDNIELHYEGSGRRRR